MPIHVAADHDQQHVMDMLLLKVPSHSLSEVSYLLSLFENV